MKAAIRFVGWLIALSSSLVAPALHAAAGSATSSLSGSVVSGVASIIGTESPGGGLDGAIVRCMLYNGASGIVSQFGSSAPVSIAAGTQQSVPISCALSGAQLQTLNAGKGTYAYIQIEQAGNTGKVIARSPSTLPGASDPAAPARFVSPSVRITGVVKRGTTSIVTGQYTVYVVGGTATPSTANFGWYTTRSALGSAIALGSFSLTAAPSGIGGVALLSGSFATTIDTAGASGLAGSVALYVAPSQSAAILANVSFSTERSDPSRNVALASAAATATASSTYGPAYAVSAVNDNNRAIGYWVDGTYAAFPDAVQINFNGTQVIDHVVVYSVQDDLAHPVEPTDTQTFSLYGITAFTVEGWNGSSWVTLGSVTGNNLVKRRVDFAIFATDRIRINVNAAAQLYSAIAEIEVWTPSPSLPPPTGGNVALASLGATATASSTYGPAYAVSAVNDNNRAAGFWVDGSYAAFPDSVQITFNGTQTIDHVVVYSVQDDLAHPVEPTDTQTFSLYGITGFAVEGWNGSTWVTLGSVSGNNLIKRRVDFAAFTTDRIRINVNAAAQLYSAIAEIEAWTAGNVALASLGATATASSTYGPAYAVSAVNDNNRASGFWVDGTYAAFPDSVQINFNGTQTIDHVVVYSVQDDLAHPVEPTDTQTFSLYGITAFTVEGWNGSTWVTLGSVSGNNLVRRRVDFAPFTTDRIRINVNAAAQLYSAIAEIEVWAVGASP